MAEIFPPVRSYCLLFFLTLQKLYNLRSDKEVRVRQCFIILHSGLFFCFFFTLSFKQTKFLRRKGTFFLFSCTNKCALAISNEKTREEKTRSKSPRKCKHDNSISGSLMQDYLGLFFGFFLLFFFNSSPS